MKLSITASGIELVNGANKISLSTASVTVNDGALEVISSHGGQGQPSVIDPRVTVSGQPVVQLPTPYTVAGCSPDPSSSWCTSTSTCRGPRRRRSGSGRPSPWGSARWSWPERSR